MSLLRSVVRSFYRFKYYTLVNLFGLILGLSCSIVLFLYVSFEFSYDQFHTDKDRIFRMSEISTSPQKKEMYPLVRIPVGPVSYTHLRAHETRHDLVCRLLLEKKK